MNRLTQDVIAKKLHEINGQLHAINGQLEDLRTEVQALNGLSLDSQLEQSGQSKQIGELKTEIQTLSHQATSTQGEQTLHTEQLEWFEEQNTRHVIQQNVIYHRLSKVEDMLRKPSRLMQPLMDLLKNMQDEDESSV